MYVILLFYFFLIIYSKLLKKYDYIYITTPAKNHNKIKQYGNTILFFTNCKKI